MKSSNIRHHQDHAQSKGRNGNSRLQTIPRRGQAARAVRAGKGQSQPRRDFTYQMQAGFFAKTSGGAGQSPSASQGAPAVHPENWAAETGKVTSRSDCAHQTPEILGPGKGTKRSPNRICASEGYLSTEPERLRRGSARSLGTASDGSRLSIV